MFYEYDMYEETMQPRARRAFRRFFKKHFAVVVSILAPYHSLQIPCISIQYPKMSNICIVEGKTTMFREVTRA
jgi:hypothetical protein